MPVGCYKQMSTIKEGVIKRLQCNCKYWKILSRWSLISDIVNSFYASMMLLSFDECF